MLFIDKIFYSQLLLFQIEAEGRIKFVSVEF